MFLYEADMEFLALYFKHEIAVFYPHKKIIVSNFIIFSITSLILSFINLYAFFLILVLYVELVIYKKGIFVVFIYMEQG